MGRSEGKKRLAPGKIILAIALGICCLVPCVALGATADSATTLIAGTTATTNDQAKKETQPAAKVANIKQTVVAHVGTSKGKVVDNGYYYITSASDMKTCAYAKGSKVKPMASNKKNAKWKLTFDKPSQSYYIVNAATNKAMTVKGKKPAGNTPVKLAKLNKDSKNQQWKLYMGEKGYYLCPAANAKLKLTISPKGKFVVAKKSKGVQRFWLLQGGTSILKSGTYTLARGKKLLNVPGMSIRSGKRLSVAANQNNLGQVFDVEHVSGDYFRIVNVNSGMAVTGVGKKAIQKPVSKGNKAQLWRAKLQPTGEVAFVNKKSKKLLLNKTWKLSPATTGLNAVSRKGLLRANKRTSTTPYCITMDLTLHELCVFQKVNKKTSGGPWKLIRWTRISSGSYVNWTNAANTTVTSHSYTFGGFNCFYWTHMRSGNMHSLLYASSSTPNRITDGRLGQYISHGCVRMPIEHAKWIYYNCHRGTAVSRYYK